MHIATIVAFCNNTCMDLSHPLSSLIPSMEATALEVLVGTQSALGPSKIHQLAHHGSRQGLVNALNRLSEHGIVIAEPTNFGYMYRFNRDHILAVSVIQAAGARHELLQRLAEATSRLTPTPKSVVLFGSLARREANASSDIDLLVVSDQEINDPESWDAQVDELSLRVQSWTGNRLQVLTHSIDHLTELANESEPIVENWLADGILLFGVSLSILIVHKSSTAP